MVSTGLDIRCYIIILLSEDEQPIPLLEVSRKCKKGSALERTEVMRRSKFDVKLILYDEIQLGKYFNVNKYV